MKNIEELKSEVILLEKQIKEAKTQLNEALIEQGKKQFPKIGTVVTNGKKKGIITGFEVRSGSVIPIVSRIKKDGTPSQCTYVVFSHNKWTKLN